jgi:hypothetical protein
MRMKNFLCMILAAFFVAHQVGDTPETLHDGLWGWLPDSIHERIQAIRLRPFAKIKAYEYGIRILAYASDEGIYTCVSTSSCVTA